MLVQTDVTARVELENKLADLTQAQLSMLEQLFPRHIIEHMLAKVPAKGSKNMRDLTNTHEQVGTGLWWEVVGAGAAWLPVEYILAEVPAKGGKNSRDLANTHKQVGTETAVGGEDGKPGKRGSEEAEARCSLAACRAHDLDVKVAKEVPHLRWYAPVLKPLRLFSLCRYWC